MTDAEMAVPLPWQEAIWERLLGQIRQGKLHHALLISGSRGIGKRLLAEHLGQSLLCATPVEGASCGQCRNCELMRAGTHPDMMRISPEESSKQIRIDQIREVAEFVMRTASIGARKVVLVDPADAMNPNAANSLLKSLEEPAPGTHLILVCDAPARLLPTLRSRCEQLRLRLPEPALARKWLLEQCGEEGLEALDAVGGRPLAARQLVELKGLEQFDRVARVAVAAAQRSAWIQVLAAELNELGVQEIFDWMFMFLLEFSRFLARPGAAPHRMERIGESFSMLAGRTTPGHVASMMVRTLGGLREIASGANPNRQLLLEALLLDWQAGFADTAGWQNC